MHDLEALKRRRMENGPMLSIYINGEEPEGEMEEKEDMKLNDLAPEVADAEVGTDAQEMPGEADMMAVNKMMGAMPKNSMAGKMLNKKKA